MRILILDDDAMRHTGFSQRWADHERTHVYRYREAVDALVSQPRFDLASLDHDLADLVDNPDTYETSGMYTPAREEYTGTDLAWFIARKLDQAKWPELVIVHSWNPDGAKRMYQLLKDAGLRVILDPYRAPG